MSTHNQVIEITKSPSTYAISSCSFAISDYVVINTLIIRKPICLNLEDSWKATGDHKSDPPALPGIAPLLGYRPPVVQRMHGVWYLELTGTFNQAIAKFGEAVRARGRVESSADSVSN